MRMIIWKKGMMGGITLGTRCIVHPLDVTLCTWTSSIGKRVNVMRVSLARWVIYRNFSVYILVHAVAMSVRECHVLSVLEKQSKKLQTPEKQRNRKDIVEETRLSVCADRLLKHRNRRTTR